MVHIELLGLLKGRFVADCGRADLCWPQLPFICFECSMGGSRTTCETCYMLHVGSFCSCSGPMVNHKKTVKDPEQQDLKAWDCRVCFGFDSYDLFSGGREEGSKGKGAGKVICRLCLCAGHAGREASSSKSNPEILRWSTTYIKTLCVPDGDKKKALFRLGLPILFVSLPPGRMAPSCHEQEAQEQTSTSEACDTGSCQTSPSSKSSCSSSLAFWAD